MVLMRLKFFRLLSLCFLFVPLMSFAADPQEDFIQKLQRKIDSITDWQADFQQKAYISSVGQSDLSSGAVKIKKPMKVFWEYVKPGRQVLVSNGKKLYFYSEEDKQVMVRDLDADTLSGANLLFLASGKKLEDIYQIEVAMQEPSSNEAVKFKMVPRKVQANLSYIVLTVDRNTLDILSLQSFDPFENNTMVEFSNARGNSGIQDKFFVFRTPKGAEVVHQ